MRQIAILAILLILFSGSAGAVTVTTATWNTGHAGGDKFPGTVEASDLYATDDLLVTDDAAVGGDLAVTGAISAGIGTISSGVYDGDFRLAANHSFYSTTGSGGIDWSNATGTWKMPTGAGTVSGTLDVEGATTTAAITVDSGSIITADQYKRRTVTNATNFTITDGGADVYLVGNGTGVNTQTVTFPTAAANKGRIITVILATDPLSNSVILDGEGSEQIDGANTKTTTDAVGSMYHLICNGVGWIKIVSSGTWS